jgi:prepilin-type N-terminal cleavage/methylation domain-containing protein
MKPNKAIAGTGFTLIELALVILIIGVLVAFAVPRFRASFERAKAIEAFNYLASVRIAQEHYHSKQNTYAANVADLDIQMTKPKYFTVPQQFTAGSSGDLEDSWTLTLTRSGSTAGYGSYTIVFTQTGFDSDSSDIIAEINPMGS